jgi:hypothetical protein
MTVWPSGAARALSDTASSSPRFGGRRDVPPRERCSLTMM